MRSILANAFPVLMASILFSGYACTSDGGITVSGSGGHSQLASGGSGSSGGTAASGGVVAAGGAPATGATTTDTNVPVGTGGHVLDSCSAGYPGNPFCGGNTGSAGVTSSAGTTGSAGATGYGGIAGAGGTGTPSDAAPAGKGCSCMAGTTTGDCYVPTFGWFTSCAAEITTWDCYCQAFDCSKTIATYTADGGTAYDVRREYANCNLVEYWTFSLVGILVDAFDLSTGQLVGQSRQNGYLKDDTCPFGDGDAPLYYLSAGRRPDSTCVLSKCSVTSSISDMCMFIDAGPPKGN